MTKDKNKYIFLIILILAGIFLFFADLISGSTEIGIKKIISIVTGNADKDSGWYNAFYLFRLPRVITALVAGAALSVSGLLMQTLFRNPLAGPYILGISSGASLGVALTVLGAGLAISSNIAGGGLSNIIIVGSGALGAALIMILVSLISLRQKDIMTLLILGVLIGSVVSAIVGLLQYLSRAGDLKIYVLWTMGSLRAVSMNELQILAPVIIIGLVLSILITKHLNLMLLGEENAGAMGSPIKLIRIIIFIAVSLMAGGITAFCGPIGFIGIAVPHIIRTIMKTSDHKWLLPGSIIAGSAIMLFADILSNFGPGATVLPINSITAIVGIPFILWLILSKRKTLFQ